MNAREYWKKYGMLKVIDLCEKAGTKYGYYKHIAYKRKRCGVDLAHRLVKFSDNEIDLLSLLPESKYLNKKPRVKNSIKTPKE